MAFFTLILVAMARLVCPKCGSNFSWITIEEDAVIQNCVCGLNKFLYFKTADGMTLTRAPSKLKNISLPARGSQLSQVLGCLVALGDLTSRQIATQLSITVDKATTNLSVLRQRGLIVPLECRKGQAGGSLWTVHANVKKKFLGD